MLLASDSMCAACERVVNLNGVDCSARLWSRLHPSEFCPGHLGSELNSSSDQGRWWRPSNILMQPAERRCVLVRNSARLEAVRDATLCVQGRHGVVGQVDLMESKFKEFMSNENERLDRDVKAADDRSAAVAAERAAQRRAEWEAICASREQQLGARADDKRQQMLEEQAFAAAWKVRSMLLVQTWRDRSSSRRRALRGCLVMDWKGVRGGASIQSRAYCSQACNGLGTLVRAWDQVNHERLQVEPRPFVAILKLLAATTWCVTGLWKSVVYVHLLTVVRSS